MIKIYLSISGLHHQRQVLHGGGQVQEGGEALLLPEGHRGPLRLQGERDEERPRAQQPQGQVRPRGLDGAGGADCGRRFNGLHDHTH